MADEYNDYTREPAARIFTQELRGVTESTKADEGKYTPTFFPLPTHGSVNRVMLMGVLLDSEDIGTDAPYIKARMSDATGSMTLYAGTYQPDVAQFLEEEETPCHVAVIGKPKLYTPENGGAPLISITPESITKVDSTQVAMWTQETARATLSRLSEMDDSDAKSAYKTMVQTALETLA